MTPEDDESRDPRVCFERDQARGKSAPDANGEGTRRSVIAL